ncbi:hypothetical protein M426DRAFT_245362 [Hypoxylon sp. CI-4A]|nr:hypothetical protein M426DRAFT_245362 [Hypoxylon sp. CI-4A]
MSGAKKPTVTILHPNCLPAVPSRLLTPKRAQFQPPSTLRIRSYQNNKTMVGLHIVKREDFTPVQILIILTIINVALAFIIIPFAAFKEYRAKMRITQLERMFAEHARVCAGITTP